MEIAVMIGLMIATLTVLTWLDRDKSGHKWVYRTPYTRTCSVCDRQEDSYCHSHSYARHGLRAAGWWEEMRPGAGEKCTQEPRP